MLVSLTMESSKKFTNRQIIAHYTTAGDRDPEKIVQFLLGELKINCIDVDEEKLAKLKMKIYNLLTRYDTKWKQANYTRERFEAKNSEWLDSNFEVRYFL